MADDDGLEQLLAENPEFSASYAVRDLHYGRLTWLAEHIRRSQFQIHETVAAKILALVEGTDPSCLFALTAVRRKDLPPAYKDPRLTKMRNFQMACEVARLGGFERAKLERACAEVGKIYGLTVLVVKRCIRPFREAALAVVEEERLADESATK